MHLRVFFMLSVLGFATGMFAAPIEIDLRKPRTNFIVIIADDMAREDCSAYGHPTLPTPALDRLAQEGMRFENAFVTTSSCSPSRASLITGRYPHATGAEQLHWPMPRNSVTFVNWLRQAGYWTAAAGKWHMGEGIKRHFDRVFGMAGQGRGRDASGCANWLQALRSRPKDRPYFLWLAAVDPHRNYDEGAVPRPTPANETVVPPYLPDVPAVREDFARYYDEIRRLDSYVGLILAELDLEGGADNTCVLFLSDNGRPFPREKTTLYDGGIRTPLLVRWPAGVAAGISTDSLVSAVDLAPTILELAGLRRSPSTMQGVSFAPVLKDPAVKVRDFVFAEQHWHDFEAYARAARDGRYKYIRNYYFDLPLTPPADAFGSPTFRAMRELRAKGMLTGAKLACFERPRPYEELYDTEADPHEMRNLIADGRHLTALRRLREAMDAWRKETGDALPKVRTEDEFDRETGERLPKRAGPRIPPRRPEYVY
jgi:N-sulfoglucosamine sulfohydrolase